MKFPVPQNEAARLAALHSYQVLDTPPEPAFDDIVKIASYICGTPIALVSLVDDKRQWFKAQIGLAMQETPRCQAFCAHTILQDDTFVVEDATRDERFAGNPLVTGDPRVRFYAGAPLQTPEGFGIGSLCVIDERARQLQPEQKVALEALARMVVTTLELRRVSAELSGHLSNTKNLGGMLSICSHCKNIRNDDGDWENVESFVQQNTNATFTHGLCPGCSKFYFPGISPGENFGPEKK